MQLSRPRPKSKAWTFKARGKAIEKIWLRGASRTISLTIWFLVNMSGACASPARPHPTNGRAGKVAVPKWHVSFSLLHRIKQTMVKNIWGYVHNRLDTIPACDRQTDGQTSCDGIVRAMHTRRAVKMVQDKAIHTTATSGDILRYPYWYYCDYTWKMWLCRGGSTDLAAAIRVIRTQMFTSSAGARPASQKVAVIMVEGRSLNETEAVMEAILARQAGISLLVVGVSATDMPLTEWIGVASYPTKINVFTVRDYDQLPTIVNRLITSVTNGTARLHT